MDGPDARDLVEDRDQRALLAELLVVGDREAVRLVPDPLERLERRRREVEDQRVEAPGVVHLLRALRQGDDRQVVEAELLEDAESRRSAGRARRRAG